MSIRRVFLARCDGCGGEVEVPESGRGGASHPSTWASVAMRDGPSMFCSPPCAAKWIEQHWPVQAATEGATT